jgi:parallel beta-helix repeat protein
MKRSALRLALLAALPMTLLAIAPVQAATQISSCPYVITAPGVYQVTQDLGPCPGTAITITASKVDLHLNGHTLSGEGGDGIAVLGQTNVSIDNGTIQGFGTGVRFRGTVDCKITKVTVRQNSNGIATGDSSSVGLTVTDCTALQNGNIGILFDGGTRASSVVRSTANGNGFAGISLDPGTFANTVTNNTANNNGDSGINLFGANGNTVERNTTDRNGSFGIGSHTSNRNTITRNSATGNGNAGIVVNGGSAQNTVQNNTTTGNNLGIAVDDGGGTTSNTVQGNTATLNNVGIWVGNGAGGNTLQGNTALDNRDVDLEDQNFGCDSNAWNNNKFVTDLVAGVPDGGPNAGCIR